MAVKLVYFAWVREKVGLDEEIIDLPSTNMTISDLITHLKNQGDNYAAAFEHAEVIRAAINQEHAEPEDVIADGCEIAIFPPMTGG